MMLAFNLEEDVAQALFTKAGEANRFASLVGELAQKGAGKGNHALCPWRTADEVDQPFTKNELAAAIDTTEGINAFKGGNESGNRTGMQTCFGSNSRNANAIIVVTDIVGHGLKDVKCPLYRLDNLAAHTKFPVW